MNLYHTKAVQILILIPIWMDIWLNLAYVSSSSKSLNIGCMYIVMNFSVEQWLCLAEYESVDL